MIWIIAKVSKIMSLSRKTYQDCARISAGLIHRAWDAAHCRLVLRSAVTAGHNLDNHLALHKNCGSV